MRLRENATYLRLSTYVDVLDSGLHMEAVADVEALAGDSFVRYRDLAATRGRWRPLTGASDALLATHRGAGFHQSARFRLESDADALRSVEVNAGLHPYSGVYTTQIDVRLGARFAEASAADLRRLAETWIDRFEPLTLQVHDVDDDAIQNIAEPRLAELGYGASAPADPALRPGREAVRGQFRFAPTWLSYVGPEALELLGPPASAAFPVTPVAHTGGGLSFVLAPTPGACAGEDFRERQAALRAALHIDDLVARDRRSFAYWKRKN